MKLTIFSNFFNHHQKPLADEFYRLLGDDFTFVATSPMPETFIKAGYGQFQVSYLLCAYESSEKKEKALELGLDSDVVILGAAPSAYVAERIEQNKITFRYAERMFKKSKWQKFNPRAIWHQYKKHTVLKNKNCHMLCSSAFTANDLTWIKAYPNKMYKWGYFTKVENHSIEQILEGKRNNKFTILYVARLIDWKHPEIAVKLGKTLKEKGYDFMINIVGSGEMQDELRTQINTLGLTDEVILKGNIPNDEVLELMKTSHAYFFSSDRNEGWGAVANEAMANGCTLVASHMIGSVPFLVRPNINGLVFESGNNEDAFLKMSQLLDNRDFCEQLATNAYSTISEVWSPNQAAHNFLQLHKKLSSKLTVDMGDGPCSRAIPTPSDWHKTA
ncbi:glycosyltransferase [Flagellimonas sediminis]|uniref:Glycosyltransferase n=1 Tax=Flagellimonas sediminis TaxID=2696468 RepID=A0A6I5KP39_9FLAO|nr:glycosyltransferase [Allomuricauda sediminis]NDV42644.1 glycosyltransferase [Allomuricauda sediminis]